MAEGFDQWSTGSWPAHATPHARAGVELGPACRFVGTQAHSFENSMCGGKVKIVAAVTEPSSIRTYLDGLGCGSNYGTPSWM